MRYLLSLLLLCFVTIVTIADPPAKTIRILVITGGHTYKVEQFNQMLSGLGDNITYKVAELPAAYDMFLPENRISYDVLVFYHMWQKITDEQAKVFAECISEGKPVVALHHSICAYDDWTEYWNIIGGKYFHKATTFRGKEYQPCSYIHDVHFNVKVVSKNNPVTKGVADFPIFDETYKGYYVEEGVTPLLSTDEPSSTPLIGWSKMYGKSRIVVLQSGHDVPTFENQNFRKLLKQSIEWVYKGIN
ncbi:MAG: ThuA domain-containing protein [Bacteroidales bacterium]|nr:ThuA domain-containing protein [Bacteroidales bacterium]